MIDGREPASARRPQGRRSNEEGVKTLYPPFPPLSQFSTFTLPFEGSNTVTQADRQGVGAGYREKLHPSIKHKCVYGTWNDRGSIFTMGFKLNCPEDLAALKSMENIYKEGTHIPQYIVPFETAVWNEEDLPPPQDGPGERCLRLPAEHQPARQLSQQRLSTAEP